MIACPTLAGTRLRGGPSVHDGNAARAHGLEDAELLVRGGRSIPEGRLKEITEEIDA